MGIPAVEGRDLVWLRTTGFWIAQHAGLELVDVDLPAHRRRFP